MSGDVHSMGSGIVMEMWALPQQSWLFLSDCLLQMPQCVTEVFGIHSSPSLQEIHMKHALFIPKYHQHHLPYRLLPLKILSWSVMWYASIPWM
jgi:hypothetical protein